MRPWCTGLLLASILVIAAVVRFWNIERYSYFFDETWIAELSTGHGSMHARLESDVLHQNVPQPTSLVGAPAWWSIWPHMDRCTHPPLFMLVLRAWREAFGESDLAARSCSVVLSLLAIVCFFDAARVLHGHSVALWACLLMALSGAQIELAQEVRPYTLLLLLACGALSALVRIEKFGSTRARLFALGACVLGMVLTHYFAAPAALAIGAYAMIRFRRTTRRHVIATLALAAGIFVIGWGPFMLQQVDAFAAAVGNWLLDDAPGHVWRGLPRLLGAPLRLLMNPPRGAFPSGYLAAIVLVLPFALMRRRPEMLLWGLWLIGSLFFVAAMDLARATQQMSYVRYTLLAGPAIYVTLAALAPRPQWLGHAIPACIALACAAALPEAYVQPKPEYRTLAAHLDGRVQSGDVVVFYATGDDAWFTSAIYLNTAHYARGYPWPFILMTHEPDEAMIQQLRQFNSIWLVNRSQEMNGSHLIPGGSVDEFAHFPFVCTVERIAPAR